MATRLQIEIGADDKQAGKVIAALEKLNTQLDVADKKITLFGDSFKTQQGLLRSYESALQSLLSSGMPTWRREVHQVQTEIVKLNLALKAQKESIAQQSVIDAYNTKMAQIGNNQRYASDEAGRLAAQMRATQTAIDGLIKAGLDPAEAEIQQLQTQFKGLNASLQQFQATASRNSFLAQFQRTGAIILDAENKVRNLQTALQNATSTRQIAQYNIRLKEAQANLAALRNIGLQTGNTLTTGMNNAAAATNNFNAAQSRSRGVFSGAVSQLRNLAAAYLSIQAALGVVRNAFNTSMKVDAMHTSFGFVIEDSEKRIDALRKQADRLGISFLTLTETNKKFVAAARASNFDMKVADDVFTAVAGAGAKLKLSNEQIGGTFLALEQMISKGTISMEELRRQLGDRLPGAFGIAARAYGVSEVAFNKMVAAGEVLTKDLFPKFAEEVRKTYGVEANERINSLQASVARLGNTWVEMLEKAGLANSVFQPFIETVNKMVRALTGLSKQAEFSSEAFFNLQTEVEKNDSALRNLIPQYVTAHEEVRKTGEGTEALGAIMNQIARVLPGVVTEWDHHGNALSLNLLRIGQVTKAQRELLQVLNAGAIAQNRRELDKYLAAMQGAAGWRDRMTREGVTSIQEGGGVFFGDGISVSLDEQVKKFTEARAKAANYLSVLQDLGAELTTEENNILAYFGLDKAGQAARDWAALQKKVKAGTGTIEQALTAIKDASNLTELEGLKELFASFVGNKAFEKAMKERGTALKRLGASAQTAAERLKDVLRQSAQETELALAPKEDKPEQRLRNTYAKRLDLAKGNAAAILQLESDLQTQLAAMEAATQAEITEKGEAERQKRREKQAADAQKFLEQIREAEIKDAKGRINTELIYQRRLHETKAQQLVRALNAEFKAKEQELEAWKDAQIEAGAAEVRVAEEVAAKKMAIQKAYYSRMEEIAKVDAQKQITLGFDGTATSEGLSRLNVQLQEIKRTFEAGGMSAADFKKQVADIGLQSEGLKVLQSAVDGVADSFGNLFGDVLFDSENAIKNLGETFKNLAKSIVSDLVKIGARYLINAAIAKATTAATVATSTAAATAVASAWATAAALAATASFGGAAVAGGVAIAALVAATKAMAATPGFRAGGYTGNAPTNAVAGIVHGREFVVNAEGTRRNMEILKMANAGVDVGALMSSQASFAGVGQGAILVDVRVTGEISGDTIRLANDRSQRNANRYFGK